MDNEMWLPRQIPLNSPELHQQFSVGSDKVRCYTEDGENWWFIAKLEPSGELVSMPVPADIVHGNTFVELLPNPDEAHRFLNEDGTLVEQETAPAHPYNPLFKFGYFPTPHDPKNN